ncbi:MAG: RNA polymerase sigma factor RpoD [SAR86 cluster bacterium SAR86B]|uniref:RNA polymerase sigma factor RpoD n=1 Tax=SAR86 cluster bacterium SAR86B TaxID=1123867 RepID=J4X4V4_9GAMM|nr:MAG: RNA polymerase sigma factor RpoD [SAR86 cluster bacterium SAR86B]
MDKISKKGSRIAELISKGREQGYLTYADVNDHLPETYQIQIKLMKLLA